MASAEGSSSGRGSGWSGEGNIPNVNPDVAAAASATNNTITSLPPRGSNQSTGESASNNSSAPSPDVLDPLSPEERLNAMITALRMLANKASKLPPEADLVRLDQETFRRLVACRRAVEREKLSLEEKEKDLAKMDTLFLSGSMPWAHDRVHYSDAINVQKTKVTEAEQALAEASAARGLCIKQVDALEIAKGCQWAADALGTRLGRRMADVE